MKTILKLSLGLAVLLLVTGSLFYTGFLRFNYPSSETYPVTGIDISHHQGLIRWEQLAESDFDFVFIKATEGGDFKDQMFLKNWQQAQRVGLKAGAYHFYRHCKNGLEQAQNFMATVPVTPQALPPVVDLEFSGNCDTPKSKATVLREIQDFMERLDQHYGQNTMIYTTPEFYHDYLVNQFTERPLWIRNVLTHPSLPNNRDWLFWQFSNRGRVKGIDTLVDLNVFKGTPEAFEALLHP